MEYRVISRDGHIDVKWLPHDLFVANTSARRRDRVPQVVQPTEAKGGARREGTCPTAPSESSLLAWNHPSEACRGTSTACTRLASTTGTYIHHPGATHTRPGDRRHRCRGDLRHPWHGGFLEDRELVGLVRDVQCLGGFCKTVPERLVGLACIPNHDPEIAAAGLRRAAKLGLKGADFGVSTAVKPIWHRDWDPLWAAADECGMPISFHTTGFSLREPLDEQMARAMTHHTGPLRSQFFRSPGPSSSPAPFSRGPWSGTQG